MASLRFPKKEKLTHKRLWDEVFAHGVSAKAFPLRVAFLKTPLSEAVRAQAGFAVPKRSFKKAVDRNRIRRQMREAYRLEKEVFFNNTQGTYALVFLYLGKQAPEYHALSRSMKDLLNKIKAHEEAAED